MMDESLEYTALGQTREIANVTALSDLRDEEVDEMFIKMAP